MWDKFEHLITKNNSMFLLTCDFVGNFCNEF